MTNHKAEEPDQTPGDLICGCGRHIPCRHCPSPHAHNPGINWAGRYACLDCGTPTPALPRDAEWLPHPLDKEGP